MKKARAWGSRYAGGKKEKGDITNRSRPREREKLKKKRPAKGVRRVRGEKIFPARERKGRGKESHLVQLREVLESVYI